ncbi:single stranded DNA-binding domain-containing protein [Streptomyces xylophagus]|uniref:single-stranded DNA-binding protein n=1 Tax=Streptomyces xylophagus TaxID=285514 RepID=UPI0005BC3C4D|nr:single-stranded DNA-binding protein [Streptomyces xylophagus]
MSGETTAVIRGRVHGAVQLRHTERGTPAARFTVIQIPREYDRARRQWHDGEPVPVICTATGPLARHVAECLTDTVHVIATGNLALRAGLLHLDAAQVGVDLAHHITYIDDTLPAVLAGRAPAQPPRTTTTTPEGAHRAHPRPAAPPAAPADWWRSPSSSRDTATSPGR